jgi:membrane-bound lytic murein transglycosylase D
MMVKKKCYQFFLSLSCIFFYTVLFASYPNIEGIQVYQKNLHLSDERKQSLADDIDRYRNADNLWDVLRSQLGLPHYEDNPLVQQQINWFMNHQDFLYRSALRAAPYLYYISQQAKKRHLPAEIVLLPMMESAYNPFAYSTAGAAGIWQMMPETASGFGIKQNWWYDGRRDVIASTKAALNYLVYLGGFFDGNWLLALAAYDTGEGNILAAIRRNTRNGFSTDFWSLPVAQETRDYVPRLLALAIIIANPDRYPVPLPPVNNAPYLAQIDMGRQIDLKQIAYLAGLSFKEMKQLNPGYTHTATDPHGPFKIILPIENVEQFSENLFLVQPPPQYAEEHKHYKMKPKETWLALAKKLKTTTFHGHSKSHLVAQSTIPKHYTLQPGDTLYMVRHGDDIYKIAAHFQMSPQTLLTINELGNRKILPPGTKLIIPTHYAKLETTHRYELAPGDTIYMVRNGDTLEQIAHKFHTSSPALRLANLMTSNEVKEGDRLVIPKKIEV